MPEIFRTTIYCSSTLVAESTVSFGATDDGELIVNVQILGKVVLCAGLTKGPLVVPDMSNKSLPERTSIVSAMCRY